MCGLGVVVMVEVVVVLVVEGVVVGLVNRKPGIGRGVGMVSTRSVSSPRRPLISWLAYSGTEWVR